MNSLQKYLSSEAHNWFSRIDYKTGRCASEVGTLERGGSGRDSTAAVPRALGRPAPSEPRALAAPTAGRSGSAVSGCLRTPVSLQGCDGRQCICIDPSSLFCVSLLKIKFVAVIH